MKSKGFGGSTFTVPQTFFMTQRALDYEANQDQYQPCFSSINFCSGELVGVMTRFGTHYTICRHQDQQCSLISRSPTLFIRWFETHRKIPHFWRASPSQSQLPHNVGCRMSVRAPPTSSHVFFLSRAPSAQCLLLTMRPFLPGSGAPTRSGCSLAV